jgi:hypothetical protein
MGAMVTRWVDNGSYVGPDRRRRPSKRLLDRRRFDEAGDPPPLAALLRRLRVRVTGPSPEDRRHALEMLKAAMGEANRLGWRHCAAALAAADAALRAGGRDAPATADARVVEAIAHAAASR